MRRHERESWMRDVWRLAGDGEAMPVTRAALVCLHVWLADAAVMNADPGSYNISGRADGE